MVSELEETIERSKPDIQFQVLSNLYVSQVRLTRPKPTPEDFERDSQVEGLYFFFLIWM